MMEDGVASAPHDAPPSDTILFNPENHSWILIDGIDPLRPSPVPSTPSDSSLAQSWTVGTDSDVGDVVEDAATEERAASPTAVIEHGSLPSLALALSEVPMIDCNRTSSVDEETFSADALEELLAAAWPLPLSRGMTPEDFHAGGTGAALYDHGGKTPYGPLITTSYIDDDDLRKPTAVATTDAKVRPPALSLPRSGTFFGTEDDVIEEVQTARERVDDGEAEAPFEWVFRVRTRGKPLAFVAALLASHAAVLILGIALGRRMACLTDASSQIGTNATSSCGAFARRFSSGPQSMYTRFCYA
jgi:hypothetical protein